MLTDFGRDIRYGLRTMFRNRLFTLVAVVTLAVGIGANAVVFSLVDRILLRALPFPEPDRIVRLLQAYPENGLDRWGLSPANFAAYRDQNRSFEAVGAFSASGATLTGDGRPEYLQAARVTADFFKVFNVSPALGRTFLPGEDAAGKNGVRVLSHRFWQRRFGSDPQIVGKSLVLNDTPTEVVGVMPPDFKYPGPEIEVWAPIALNPQAFHPFLLTGVARLKPGTSPESAAADTTSILRNAAQENLETVSRKSPPPPGAGLKTQIAAHRGVGAQLGRAGVHGRRHHRDGRPLRAHAGGAGLLDGSQAGPGRGAEVERRHLQPPDELGARRRPARRLADAAHRRRPDAQELPAASDG